MQFNDLGYVQDYRATGKLPAIHDHIWRVYKEHVPKFMHVVDLGCCTGLLAVRFAHDGAKVRGIDCNQTFLNNAVTESGVMHTCVKITPETIESALWNVKKQLVVARRIIPEISCEEFGTIVTIAKKMHAAGCHVLLEGRKYSKRSTAVFNCIEIEVEAFVQAGYKLQYSEGDVAYLIP